MLLSPFDVRQGNFTGALINAVTKSGTNEFHGSAYYYFRNQDLAADVPLLRASEFQQKQYGFSLGGPIVKDKIHFFVAPEWQSEAYPAPGPYPGSRAADPPSAADAATVQRMADILKNTYGLDAGATGARVRTTIRCTNVFARLDFVLPYNSRLVLRDNYGKAELDTLFRTIDVDFASARTPTSFNNKKNAAVAQLFTNWNNGANNELFLGYTTIRDDRPPDADFPSITVNTGITGTLIAGAESNSQGNSLDQDIFEITDNFTIPVGAKHRLSIGTHNEFYKIDNLFARNSEGAYTFASLDSLEAGNPNAYTIGLNLGQGFHSKFNAANYSVYAEDQWTINDRFNVLYGVRLDLPTISSRPADESAHRQRSTDATRTSCRRGTSSSPRAFGFNYDITGKQTDQLRGGVGLFQGRPAFVWLENTIANSGFGLGLLVCGAGGLGTRASVHARHRQSAADVPRFDRRIRRRGRVQRSRSAQQESQDAADGCARRWATITSSATASSERSRGSTRAAQQLLLSEPEPRRAYRRRSVRPHDLRDGVLGERHADDESRQHAVQGGRHLRREESVEGLFVPAHGAAQEALLRLQLEASGGVHARTLVLGAGHHEQHSGVELQVRPRARQGICSTRTPESRSSTFRTRC